MIGFHKFKFTILRTFISIIMEKDQYSEISHGGLVQLADGSSVTVLLSSETNCTGCLEKNACNLSGKENKIVTIPGHYNVRTGDHVTISMRQSMGYFALFLGYLLPLLLVVLALVLLLSLSVNELLSGLLSIGILLPYYLILIVFRKRINKKFSFTLKI